MANPGVVDVSASWTKSVTKSMIGQLEHGERDKFNKAMRWATRIPGLARTLAFRGRPYAHTDWFDLFSAVREYRLHPETAADITTPLLITDPENEAFWPGQSRQLAQLVGADAHLVEFAAADGAGGHCQPLARATTDQRMYDWLELQIRR